MWVLGVFLFLGGLGVLRGFWCFGVLCLHFQEGEDGCLRSQRENTVNLSEKSGLELHTCLGILWPLDVYESKFRVKPCKNIITKTRAGKPSQDCHLACFSCVASRGLFIAYRAYKAYDLYIKRVHESLNHVTLLSFFAGRVLSVSRVLGF